MNSTGNTRLKMASMDCGASALSHRHRMPNASNPTASARANSQRARARALRWTNAPTTSGDIMKLRTVSVDHMISMF